jgi:hypothetical protein
LTTQIPDGRRTCAIAAGFVYFHSTTDNAIGKLPLP